jgi:hypothetical protein
MASFPCVSEDLELVIGRADDGDVVFAGEQDVQRVALSCRVLPPTSKTKTFVQRVHEHIHERGSVHVRDHGRSTTEWFGRTGVPIPLAVGSRPQFRECLRSASLPWINTSCIFWLPLVVFHDLFLPPPILQISCSKSTRRGLSLLLLLI